MDKLEADSNTGRVNVRSEVNHVNNRDVSVDG